jgi:hypothetical protein
MGAISRVLLGAQVHEDGGYSMHGYLLDGHLDTCFLCMLKKITNTTT